jgi:hypothetical protein
MKTFNTIESIGAELDSLYNEVTAGDMTSEDRIELNMRLLILRQRAELLKNHALEAKLEQLEEIVRARFKPELRRIG